MWVSHLGCIKGCVDYLGLDVSDRAGYTEAKTSFIRSVEARARRVGEGNLHGRV